MLTQKEAIEWLEHVLDELLLPEAEAVRRRYLKNESVGEIATAVGRSPSAVSGLLKRAMAKLRGRVSKIRSTETWPKGD